MNDEQRVCLEEDSPITTTRTSCKMAWESIDVHGVVERGDMPALTQYLSIGGDPNKQDPNYGATPVHWAAFHGMCDALALLLDHGAHLEARTNTGGTALAWGSMGGDARVVQRMLDRGADISAVNQGKGTALHHATHSGHPEVVDMLLHAGANPSAKDSHGELPGDSFDREVSDADRRAIVKALKKAKKEGHTERSKSGSKVVAVVGDSGKKSRFRRKGSFQLNRTRSGSISNISRSKKKRPDTGTSKSKSKSKSNIHRREGENKMESTSSFYNCALAEGSMLASVQQFQSSHLSHRDLLLLKDRQDDTESLLAAKAALAAAAWSPRHLHQNGNGNQNGDGNGNGSENGIKKGNDSRNGLGGQSRFSSSGRKHVGFAETPSCEETGERESQACVGSVSISVANGSRGDQHGNVLEAAEETGTGTAEVDAELGGLLRRTKELTLAAEEATARDVESRNALKRGIANADQRASEAVKAERARSDGLYALVQALEQRLQQKEKHLRVLQARLEERDARLRQTGHVGPGSIEEVQLQKDKGGDEVIPRRSSSNGSQEATSTERDQALTEVPPSAPTVEDSGSRVVKRSWWKKDRQDQQEGTLKKHSPPPAAVGDQERSGKLFALMGRK